GGGAARRRRGDHRRLGRRGAGQPRGDAGGGRSEVEIPRHGTGGQGRTVDLDRLSGGQGDVGGRRKRRRYAVHRHLGIGDAVTTGHGEAAADAGRGNDRGRRAGGDGWRHRPDDRQVAGAPDHRGEEIDDRVDANVLDRHLRTPYYDTYDPGN